jgi:hypothetical protein
MAWEMTALTLFLEQGDELLLLGYQRIYLGGFVVEDRGDICLLRSRRYRQQDVPHLRVIRAPKIGDYAFAVPIELFLERHASEQLVGERRDNLVQRFQDNVNQRNRSISIRKSSGAFAVRPTINDEVASADLLAIVAIIGLRGCF